MTGRWGSTAKVYVFDRFKLFLHARRRRAAWGMTPDSDGYRVNSLAPTVAAVYPEDPTAPNVALATVRQVGLTSCRPPETARAPR